MRVRPSGGPACYYEGMVAVLADGYKARSSGVNSVTPNARAMSRMVISLILDSTQHPHKYRPPFPSGQWYIVLQGANTPPQSSHLCFFITCSFCFIRLSNYALNNTRICIICQGEFYAFRHLYAYPFRKTKPPGSKLPGGKPWRKKR